MQTKAQKANEKHTTKYNEEQHENVEKYQHRETEIVNNIQDICS